MDIDLAVVGGGPVGIEAALEGRRHGLSVALVAEAPVGGRATFGSLVPSKVWLNEAERGRTIAMTELGRMITERSDLLSRKYRHSLKEAGVTVFSGHARLLAPGRIEVESETESPRLHAKTVLLATGSEPRFDPDVRPDGVRLLAPRYSKGLPDYPRSVAVAGGGVTGCEYAFAMSAMGSSVTILANGGQLLPRVDAEIAERFAGFLTDMGISIRYNAKVTAMSASERDVTTRYTADSTLHTDYGFIATGRRPDMEFETEDGPHVARDGLGWVVVDDRFETSIPGVYAAGDLVGPPLTVNRGLYHARRAVSAAAGREPGKPVAFLTEAVYTDPQVAQLGDVTRLSSSSAGVRVVRREYSRLVKAHLTGETVGLLKIWVRESDDHIVGASCVGREAAELLSPLQIAMVHRISLGELAEVPLAHPTFSELATSLHA